MKQLRLVTGDHEAIGAYVGHGLAGLRKVGAGLVDDGGARFTLQFGERAPQELDVGREDGAIGLQRRTDLVERRNGDDAPVFLWGEIGRASCRGRVEIAGGAW